MTLLPQEDSDEVDLSTKEGVSKSLHISKSVLELLDGCQTIESLQSRRN